MRPLPRTGLALVAGVALAACSDQPASAPTAVNPVRPSFALISRPTWLTGSCDATQLKSDARAYAKKSNDVLVSIAGDLGAEVSKKGLTRVATNKALDGLSRIAAIRGTGDQNSDVTAPIFDRLVKGFLVCTELEFTDGALEPTPPGGGGFGGALGSHWAFEVRGQNTDATGIFERNKPAAAAAAANKFWVLQPGVSVAGVPDWAASIGGTLGLSLKRVFIYGYQTSATPAIAKAGSSFDHRSIPLITSTFTMSLKVGLCGQEATGGLRVNHAGEFGALSSPSCSPSPSAMLASSSIYAALNPIGLARRAVHYFAPQELHAAVAGIVGRDLGSLSPSAVYDLSQYLLSGLGTIADGQTTKPLKYSGGSAVTIRVTVDSVAADGITKIPVNAAVGTPVAISVVGNSSVIAYFTDGKTGTPSPTVTRYVAADPITGKSTGIASFDEVYLTKAGGYQVAFQVALVNATTGKIDFAGAQVLTLNSFNMQGK